MDFYDRVGVAALGSRLRRLGDRLAEDAAKVYELYENPLQPRWYPVFQILQQRSRESVSEIANEIGQSHASVSQIAKDMERNGFLRFTKDESDSRRSYLELTELGIAAGPKMTEQLKGVGAAVEALLNSSSHNLWLAMADCEEALEKVSLLDRVREVKSKEDSAQVKVERFSPRYAEDFRQLNEEWITRYFELEDSDQRQLGDPQKTILEKGGDILFAFLGEECIGTCALIPHGEDCLELAKMAISPSRRGLGLGAILGKAALNRAREMGARTVYLESNRGLTAAIRLYRSLGFQEVVGAPSPYARADIQMELML
ncbi:bifunctional helix-turn-helix transcriptional regulator/GNAT family N-acetyltransferase [Pelagicoccus albus]|uniref:Bifunctional helix-turn-helix transcriptional regulator/GNAT family N-acetyltransferase n=1 Tax=Pelagicoccus albus TaxID=415222 RepID=A0A7X1B817_9BACT|nr:bifunctional helix-turn-helix transcriptional regulator/GNAT family N-acetyltransferase [Pelagicoccus albus]MBC2607360.1 bifunctional helix-turn-helix transcriptional regulator/GNAT family N-acetyltransferase [Pelagicoccus albus]